MARAHPARDRSGWRPPSRADLTEQLRAFVHLTTRTPAGRVLAELIGATRTDPELAATHRELYAAPRRALAVEALTRPATAVSSAPTSIPRPSSTSSGAPACYHRLLIPDQPLDETVTDTLVAQLLGGLRPHGEP